MPKSKEEINARRRELYQIRKAAGLTRKQARAPKRSAETSYDVFKALREVGDKLASQLKQLPLGSIEDFARDNPGLSKKDVYKRFKEAGGKATHSQVNAAVNKVKGQITYVGRTKKSNPARKRKKRKKPTPKPKRIKMYGQGRAPNMKSYYKTRYSYVVKYNVRVTEFLEPETRYATVSTDTRLDHDEVITEFFRVMMQIEEQDEKYNVEGIDEDSVEILYGIDNQRK